MTERHMHNCKRCGHTWMSGLEHPPKFCAGCHSPYYNKPRTKGIVEAISRQHTGEPAHIIPVEPIDQNNVIIRQRKGFERKHKQAHQELAEA